MGKKSFCSRLTTSNGFTLAEVMIALGVGGIVMAGIIGGLSMTMAQRKIADHPVETAALMVRMTLATAKTAACTANLANGTNSVNATTPQVVSIDGVTENSDLGKGFKVAAMKISVDANPIPLTSPPNGKRYAAQIQFQTSQVINGTNRISKPRLLPLHVNVDANGLIVSCNADVSDQIVCMENGGAWDAAAPAGLNCTPLNHCLYGGSYSSLPAANGGFKNTATGGQGCPAGFTQQQAGEVNIARKNGKYGVQNVAYPVFNCVRCGTPNATVAPDAAVVAGTYDELNTAANLAYEAQMNAGNALSALGASLGLSITAPVP